MKKRQMERILNREYQEQLLGIVKDSIGSVFHLAEYPILDPPEDSPLLLKAGVFVTLKLNGNLRGCIGNIVSQKPLWRSVAEMSKASAFEDYRFSPLAPEEYQNIEIEISVLSPPVEIFNFNEIEIGKHGIIISHGFNRGLFLPQVPVEQGWNLDQYLSYGCRKAGLPMDFWKKDKIQLEIFTAFVFS